MTVNNKRALRKRAETFSLTTDRSYVFFSGKDGEENREVITGQEAKMCKIKTIHEGFGGGHFGRDKTREKVMKRYYRRNIVEDVFGYVRTCETCQKAARKFARQAGALHPIPVTGIWDQVGVDMIGPLPATASGNRYLITLCDYFSKWPEAVAVKDKSGISAVTFLYETMASNLYAVRQQYHYGFPPALKQRLRKLRRFEVEFDYITKVLTPPAIQHLYRVQTGCDAEEAERACGWE